MRKIIMMILIGLISMGFIGCTPQPNFENAPNWVVGEPKLEGYVTGVGIASTNLGDDLALQRSEALAEGKKNLAGKIESTIINFLDKYTDKTTKTYTGTTKDKLKIMIKQKVRGARVKESWIRSDGKLFILMVIEKKEIAKDISNSVQETLKEGGLYLTEEKMENLSKEILSM